MEVHRSEVHPREPAAESRADWQFQLLYLLLDDPLCENWEHRYRGLLSANDWACREVLEPDHSGPTLHSKNKKRWPRFTPLAWDFLKLHFILRLFLPKPFFSPFFNICQTHFMVGSAFWRSLFSFPCCLIRNPLTISCMSNSVSASTQRSWFPKGKKSYQGIQQKSHWTTGYGHCKCTLEFWV